jgi:hypothetical protein
MKIIDAIPKQSSYLAVYKGEKLKKNEDGDVLFQNGHAQTVNVRKPILKEIFKFRFLVDGCHGVEWLSDGEIVVKYGRKKFKGAMKNYLARDNNEIDRLRERFKDMYEGMEIRITG